jgi:hypothetical protein
METSVLLKRFELPLNAVKLARFVTSVEKPEHGYHDHEVDSPAA